MRAPTARLFRIGIALYAGLASALVAGTPPVVFNVNSELDEVDTAPGDTLCHSASDFCTLRAALMEANLLVTSYVVVNLPTGDYDLTIAPSGGDGPESGDLDLTSPGPGTASISIVGSGSDTTVIDAKLGDRVLQIGAGRFVTVTSVRFQNGKRTGGAGPDRGFDVDGGGIFNSGTLNLSSCVVTGSQAPGAGGGGVFNNGTLILNKTTIGPNNSAYAGGGISNLGTLRIYLSTLFGNIATTNAGAILNGASLEATNSTISTNSAGENGGGIWNSAIGDGNLYNVTIVLNHADTDFDDFGLGGGVSNSVGGILNLRNSLLGGNQTGDPALNDDCSGTVGFYGRNRVLSVPKSCSQAGTGLVNPLETLDYLEPLRYNGGDTRTHGLLPFSIAIDDADPDLGCIGADSVALPIDQRGVPRSLGNRCDVGAYEFGPLFFDGFESGSTSHWEN